MSLVIDDEHIGSVKEYINEQCESIDSIVSRYVRTMENVIETGIMEGTTAEALKEFLSQVESDIGDNSATPGKMAERSARYCDNFIKHVDKADKQIY